MSGVEAVAWSVPTALPPEFPWRKRESERVTKLTKEAQPEHGFTAALYSQATVDTLRAQLEAAEARHAATERDACRQAEQTNEWKSRAEVAEAECARLREDAERLDFLDRMNASLNAHYGTNYGWRLVLSHQITRLMSGEHRGGFVGDIDLNDQDGSRDKAASCRDAIDAARTKEETK